MKLSRKTRKQLKSIRRTVDMLLILALALVFLADYNLALCALVITVGSFAAGYFVTKSRLAKSQQAARKSAGRHRKTTQKATP